MAEKIARNNVCGVIKISDGTTPTAEEIELVFDNGSLTITPGGEETHIRYDRNEIAGAVKGKDIPSDISFECDFVEFYKEAADADPTPFEVFHKVGGAAARKATKDIGGAVGAGIVSYAAVTPGAAGNAITVFHQTGGAESIAVVGSDITITLNTGTSTAASVVALVAGSPAALALITATVKVSGVIDAEGAAIHLANGWDGWKSRIDGNKHGLKFTWEIANPDPTGEDETIVLDRCYVEPGGNSISENEDVDKITFKLKSLDKLPTITRT